MTDALADFGARTRDSDTATLVEERDRLLVTMVAEVTHDAALTAWQRLVDAIPDLIMTLEAVDSPDDFSVSINASAFGDAQPRVAAACADLEGLASALRLTADLQCGDARGP